MADASTAFTREQYAEPYPPGIEKHYWHRARNRILERKLVRLLGPSDRVLDIGCGPGIAVGHLRHRGVNCFGVDLGTPIPATSDVAPFLRLGASALDLEPRFRESLTTLLFLDVLEHLPSPRDFLHDCITRFPNARRFFVTLPACMEIWSNYDEYYGHFRRYTLESLHDIAYPNELRLLGSGYFFHSLYWAARAFAKTQRSTRVSAPKLAFVHAAVGRFLDLEERLVPGTLRGSSLYALFERS